MSRASLPPLPADVLALLEGERDALEEPHALRARVWTQLEARLGAALGPAAPGDATPGSSATPAGPPAPPPVAATAGPASGLAGLFARPLVLSFALGLVAGGGLGAGAHALLGRRPAVERRAPADAPAVPVTAAALAPPSSAAPAVAGTAARPPDSAPALVTAAPRRQDPPRRAAFDADLAEERALIERAQTALARRHPDAALAALRDHQARFSHGQLAEEREALVIVALAGAGRSGEALARRSRFLRRFPHSLLRPAVEAALPAAASQKAAGKPNQQ